jgi:hypothetical protein
VQLDLNPLAEAMALRRRLPKLQTTTMVTTLGNLTLENLTLAMEASHPPYLLLQGQLGAGKFFPSFPFFFSQLFLKDPKP